MTSAVPIDEAMHDDVLLGAALGSDRSSWAAWIAILKAAYGLRLDGHECELFAACAGGRAVPPRKVKELVVVASRRSGKGRIGAALAVHAVLLTDHSAVLAPGETGVVACVSPTRAQSEILLDYCRGYLESSPLLRGELRDVTQDELRLANGNVITTLTSDYRSLRGRTLLLAVLDEAAFLRDELSASPDVECARALAPGLATTKGMLCILSSPYRRSGLLFQRHKDFFGKSGADTLVVQAASRLLNPTLDASVIASAREADAFAAQSEWLGEFRSDLSAFLDDALIEAAIDYDRPLELPPWKGIKYAAFCDPSGGRGDAFGLCIGHYDGDRFVADLVRTTEPPFDPSVVVGEIARLLGDYSVREICGDNYSGEWVVEAFRVAGIRYIRADKPKSQLYLESLPVWARSQISIPNHPRLLRELRLLERRTHRSGRDAVDCGRAGGHDNAANALVGCLVTGRAALKLAAYTSGKWIDDGDEEKTREIYRRALVAQHIYAGSLPKPFFTGMYNPRRFL